MGNELTIGDRATGSSTLALTPSAKSVLERAFDPASVFTAAELALIEPVASAIALPMPADERTIRQSIGSLSSALPAQATDEISGKLKLKAYTTMLAGCDQRALAYACRRCLDELDWFPTVHQLKQFMAKWVSEDEAAIRRARAIFRVGKRAPEAIETITEDQAARANAYLRTIGVRTQIDAHGEATLAA